MPEWAKKLELIDTLWNVNDGWSVEVEAITVQELIDTLWNVNEEPEELEEEQKKELIDTLWNVNAKITASEAGASLRINRYIMECKY